MSAPAEPRCVVLFASIHDVMRFEATLRENGRWCDLVPVPRALSAECGMALQVRAADLDAVRALATAHDARATGVFRETPDGYRPA